ncbi:hypothetical protein ATKI12_5417 [Kitasatospora sp. Ki12]|uniref:hypothetical protein n=1 Tax=Kitasatospora xanthocidica TaxID=83382 RepID=UPI00167637A3|nr:hypothetical protein [Kitasatospora xanthocidica]GHF54805.1 hypothetical protein GCM10018790_35920 [Kitasatospora xanthocidica]
MPATDQRALGADEIDDVSGRDDLAVDHAPGTDPGEAENWDVFRVNCPDCRRPIALVADEERLPQHALLPTAWNPFTPAICPGSGTPTDDLAEVETPEDAEPTAFDTLFKLPNGLDWRTQPFSHAVADRPVRMAVVDATVPAVPVPTVAALRSIPEQRRRLVRR